MAKRSQTLEAVHEEPAKWESGHIGDALNFVRGLGTNADRCLLGRAFMQNMLCRADGVSRYKPLTCCKHKDRYVTEFQKPCGGQRLVFWICIHTI